MSNPNSNYTQLDEKIDKYLGTNNLRPGPPKRLINKKLMGEENSTNLQLNKKSNIVKDEKQKINFFAETLKISRKIKWKE
jgi:hypothetical protein